MVNADPMVSASVNPEDVTNQSPVLSTPTLNRQGRNIKPITDDEEAPSDDAVAEDKPETEETSDDAPAEKTAEVPELPKLDITEGVDTKEPDTAEEPEESKSDPKADEENDKPGEDKASEKPAAAKKEKKAERMVLQPPSEDADSKDKDKSVDEDSSVDEDESTDAKLEEDEDKDIAETEEALKTKTAEQIRQDELEELVQKGTYAVPINQVARKRAVVLLSVCLVLILLAALVDLLLDMGLLAVSGVPHTNFFHP